MASSVNPQLSPAAEELEVLLPALFTDAELQFLPAVHGQPSFRVRVQGGTADDTVLDEPGAVDLTFTYTKRYPNEALKLEIAAADTGLDKNQLDDLFLLANSVVRQKLSVHEVCVYDVFMCVKAKLDEWHALRARGNLHVDMEAGMAQQALSRMKVDAQRLLAAEAQEQVQLSALLAMRAQPASSPPSRHASVPPSPSRATAAGAPTAPEMSVLPVSSADASSSSRFRTDFVDLGALGKGGFGRVVKVLNRMDVLVYAVKIIPLEAAHEDEGPSVAAAADAANTRLLREVKTLSRLNHAHVVRYYQAWSEIVQVQGGKGVTGGAQQHQGVVIPIEDDAVVLPRGPGRGKPLAAVVESDSSDWLGLHTSHSARLIRRGARRRRPSNLVPNAHGNQDDRSSDSDSSDSDSEEDRIVAVEAQRNPLVGGGGLHLDALLNTGGFGDGPVFSSLDEHRLYPSRLGVGSGTDSMFARTDAGATGSATAKELQASTDEILIGGPAPKAPRSALDAKHAMGAPVCAPAPPHPARPSRLLYIQMEYCPETLRKRIDVPLDSPAALDDRGRWRVLRQTLEALAYVHGQGVLHRDVKPLNILLDGEGNVKLGDLGLAVAQKGASGGGVGARPTTELYGESDGEGEDTSISTGVGTALYRAPEVTNPSNPGGGTGTPGAAKYDSKADMYSVGVVTFELWHGPFSTGMERLSVLRGVRESEGRVEGLPSSFRKRVPPDVIKLLPLLLARDPTRRMSADDLLSSPLVPARGELETAYMREAVAALSAPHSVLAAALVDRLFARQVPDHVDLAWDVQGIITGDTLGPGAGAAAPRTGAILTPPVEVSNAAFVRRIMALHLERRGAVWWDMPALIPRSAPLSAFVASSFSRILAMQLVHYDAQGGVHQLAAMLFGAPALPGSGMRSSALEQLMRTLAHDFTALLRPPACSPLGRACGAASATRDLSLPGPDAGGVASASVLLDPSGIALQLQHDLCLPWARHASRRNIQCATHWSVGTVYRAGTGVAAGAAGSGLAAPRGHLEGMYDVIRPRGSGVADMLAGGALEAEVVGVAYGVVHAAYVHALAVAGAAGRIPSLGPANAMFVRVGNSKVTSGLLDLCAVPVAMHGAFSQLLGALTSGVLALESAGPRAQRESVLNWQDVRRYLLGMVGLSQATVDSLQPLFSLPAVSIHAVLDALDAIIARHHGVVLKRVHAALTSQTTQDRKTSALQQLRGLLFLQQGTFELAAFAYHTASAAEGSQGHPTVAAYRSRFSKAAVRDSRPVEAESGGVGTSSPASVETASMATAESHAHEHAHVSLPRDMSASRMLEGLVMDLGLGSSPTDSAMYSGCLFQVILMARGKAASLRLQPGRAPSRQDVLGIVGKAGTATTGALEEAPMAIAPSIETLLKIRHAFNASCERDCVARGGRYEELLLRYRDRLDDTAVPPHALHARFAVQKLATALSAVAAKAAREVSSSQPVSPSTTAAPGMHRSSMMSMHRLACASAGRLLPGADVLVWSHAPSHAHAHGKAAGGAERANSQYAERTSIARALRGCGLVVTAEHPVLHDFDDARAHATAIGASVLVSLTHAHAGHALPHTVRLDVRDVTGLDTVTVGLEDVAAAVLRHAALSVTALHDMPPSLARSAVHVGLLTSGGADSAALWAAAGVGSEGGAGGGGFPVGGTSEGGLTGLAQAGGGVHASGSLHERGEAWPAGVALRIYTAGDSFASGGVGWEELQGGPGRRSQGGGKRQPLQSRISSRLLLAHSFLVHGLSRGGGVISVLAVDAPWRWVRELGTVYAQAVGASGSSGRDRDNADGGTGESVLDKASALLSSRLDGDRDREGLKYKRHLREAMEGLHRLQGAGRGGANAASGGSSRLSVSAQGMAQACTLTYSLLDDRFDTLL